MKPDPQRAKDTESAAGAETEKATPKVGVPLRGFQDAV